MAPPTILVLELEAVAPRQGLDVDDAHAELAVAAGLLLVRALDAARRAGDRLAVGDPHVLGVDVGAELAGQLLERDLQVGLAGALEQRLVGLVVALDHQRRVLVLEAVQGGGQPVLVGLGLGHDRHGQRAARAARSGGTDDRLALGGERVAGGGAGQLGDRADVAGHQLAAPAPAPCPAP